MMKKIDTAIIGGGASGMFCAALLNNENCNVLLIEKGERLGRKLSATGNGQGNVTNLNFGVEHYFTSNRFEREKIEKILSLADKDDFLAFLEGLGGLFEADERGRVYPTGRQASAITDLLRFYIDEKGIKVLLSSTVVKIEKQSAFFILTLETPQGKELVQAKNVVVCAGGKAAKNFGTDGSAYALLKSFSHTVTSLYPALVQVKTEVKDTKALKGIRSQNAVVEAYEGGKFIAKVRGDVIFTDYGVSGDAIFRISSYITEKAETGNIVLSIDLLPDVPEDKLQKIVEQKAKNKTRPFSELLCGILNNQIGRVVMKRAGEISLVVKTVKKFTLNVTGTLSFDYAQVTKGGIPLSEVDDCLQSKKVENLYLAGEILDVDGECGGYNLQWAYSSAKRIATEINKKNGERK